MPSTVYTFNVILPPDEAQKLRDLAEKDRTSRGATVRKLIMTAHQMTVAGIPTCADGQRCFVPQSHARPPSPPPSIPQP